MDGITWLSYDYDRIFKANTDTTTVVTNQLRTPLKARAVRINPLTWNNYISMRVEVYILSE
jgi:hypothetical protein